MVSDTVMIQNPTGLHARPAAKLVELAKQYTSAIAIEAGERKCDAKSIFSLLRCCFKMGEEVTVCADGTDEAAALKDITECIRTLVE